MSTNTQTEKIRILNESIGNCNSFKSISKNEKIVLPTGDGMAIGFLNGLEGPLQLAIELQKKLKEYNEKQVKLDKIFIRIGCHSGNIFVVNDIQGNKNFWGPGLILSRRVMDIGDAGHILMTASMAESLLELSNDFKKIIHPLHDYQIKHGDVILLYSVYDESFGNSSKPQKGLIEENKTVHETDQMRERIQYNDVQFKLKLKDPHTQLFQFTRTYEFMNKIEEPIFQVVNGINTNVNKTFDTLKIKAFDENKNELKFVGISIDAPKRKEFTIKLNNPVFQDGKQKKYSITYECEEPNNFYEHMFLINSQKLSLQLIFPTEIKLKPQLYIIQKKDRKKKLLDIVPERKEGVLTQLEWKKNDITEEKDLIRLEW